MALLRIKESDVHPLQLQWNVERRAIRALWHVDDVIQHYVALAHHERATAFYCGMRAIDEAYNQAMLHTVLPLDKWVGIELDRGVIRRFIPVTA